MTRFLPYSTRPLRLFVQLMSDVIVSVWTVVWVFIALAVHGAISTIAEAGRLVGAGSKGVAGNLASAGHGALQIPVLGDPLSKPLIAASDAALDIAGAGHNLNTTATWLAVVLAIAVAATPMRAAGRKRRRSAGRWRRRGASPTTPTANGPTSWAPWC